MSFMEYMDRPEDCPYGPHRGPEGPNEDTNVCGSCGQGSYSKRPIGESFGWHHPSCSLPMDHEGKCKPGGVGHLVPEGWTIRG
jgi:hypothetical protein